MSEGMREESSSSFIVINTMNSHGAITVQSTDDHATYHVVEYEDGDLRDRLASLTEGSQIRMSVERAGVRANVWRATKLAAGTGKATPVRA
ncbi:hypothetical protein [Salinigranum sp. GCM10025319]|uniref:hypothetical protein n=1 Tax=Salinigranum sp. GCM10025319 TaxID=3252687 RepID=UPI0036158DCB